MTLEIAEVNKPVAYVSLGTEVKDIDEIEPVILTEYSPVILPNSTTPIVSWQNLSVYTFSTLNHIDNIKHFFSNNFKQEKLEGKALLKNVTGQIQGGLHGVMGSSGRLKLCCLECFCRL